MKGCSFVLVRLGCIEVSICLVGSRLGWTEYTPLNCRGKSPCQGVIPMCEVIVYDNKPETAAVAALGVSTLIQEDNDVPRGV
jgi:hypothetical protein